MSLENRQLSFSLPSTSASSRRRTGLKPKKRILQWNVKDTNVDSVDKKWLPRASTQNPMSEKSRIRTRVNLNHIANIDDDSLSSDEDIGTGMTIDGLDKGTGSHFFRTSASGFLANVTKYVVFRAVATTFYECINCMHLGRTQSTHAHLFCDLVDFCLACRKQSAQISCPRCGKVCLSVKDLSRHAMSCQRIDAAKSVKPSLKPLKDNAVSFFQIPGSRSCGLI